MIKEKSSTCAYIPFYVTQWMLLILHSNLVNERRVKSAVVICEVKLLIGRRATLQQTTTKVGKITAAKSSLATVRFDN